MGKPRSVRALEWAGALGLGCVLWASCGSDPPRNNNDDDDDSTSTVTSSSVGGVGGAGGSGSGSGGATASSTAAGTGGSPGTGGSGGSGGQPAECLMGPCAPKGAVCTAVSSCCIALEDNTFKPTFALRMAQLSLAEPLVFAQGVVGNIFKNAVQMNLDQCNLAGAGTLSWLLEINSTTKTLKTGGGKPAADPTAGYCFVDELVNGLFITAPEVSANLDNAGVLSASVGDILLPMYLDQMAASLILLPIHELTMTATLSPDRNCIGVYNADKLEPVNNCLSDGNIPAFANDGAIAGYMTLEDTDAVIVDALNQSLCVLLSGDAATYGDGGMPAKCKRDPNTSEILYKGNWCSVTNSASSVDCYDAAHLQGEFAASAVTSLGNCP